MRGAWVQTFMRRLTAIGLLLILTDVVFGLLAVGLHEGFLFDTGLSLEVEHGHAEVFQYVKEFWIILCCGFLLFRTRQPVYGALGLVFGYILADDALSIHERVGAHLAPILHVALPMDATPQDLGELVFFVAMGVALLLTGLIAYRFSDRSSRAVARMGMAGLAVLAIFGVVVDAVHAAVWTVRGLGFALEVLEDGGELVVMSIIAAGAISTACRWWPPGARAYDPGRGRGAGLTTPVGVA